MDEGIFVLAVTDTGGVMVKTPSASAERNVVHRNSQVAIDDSCRVTISAEAELSGHFAQSSRNYVRGEKHEDVMSYIKDYFAGGNSQYVVDSCGTKYEDSLAAPFVLTARMRTTRPIDRLNGGIYYFPFSLTARAPYEGLDLTNRTVPVNLRYPYVVVDSTTIRTHWNSLADSVRLPASDSVAYPDGFVKVNFTRDSLGISGVLTQYFGAKILKVDDFPRFSAFLAARKKLLDRPIKWYVSSTR